MAQEVNGRLSTKPRGNTLRQPGPAQVSTNSVGNNKARDFLQIGETSWGPPDSKHVRGSLKAAGGTHVDRVLFRCPLTERLVPTGLESDGGRAFRLRLPSSAAVRCVACHRMHSWHRGEAILEGRERKPRLASPDSRPGSDRDLR